MTRRASLLGFLAGAGVGLLCFVVFVGLRWWQGAAIAGMGTVLCWLSVMTDLLLTAPQVVAESRYSGTDR